MAHYLRAIKIERSC